MPPWRTSRSAAAPSAGLAVMPGIAVRAAALQRQHQLRGGHAVSRFALRRRSGASSLIALDARLDGLLGAAGLLDGHACWKVSLSISPYSSFMRPIWNTSQPRPTMSDAGEIGVGGIAPLGALQDVEALARRPHAAAGAVHERDDAVDVGIVGEDAGALDLLGHEARDRGRAVHGGENADVVARAGPCRWRGESPRRWRAARGGRRQSSFASSPKR